MARIVALPQPLAQRLVRMIDAGYQRTFKVLRGLFDTAGLCFNFLLFSSPPNSRMADEFGVTQSRRNFLRTVVEIHLKRR